MASNKSLMESINTNVKEINEHKFGTKLPSNENKQKDIELKDLAYEQMIMSSLASLTWGVKNVNQETRVKSLLGQRNIFNIVNDIYKEIKSITSSYNGSNNASSSTQAKLTIEFSDPNITSNINKFIEAITDGALSDKNQFVGINSIVELFSALSAFDFTSKIRGKIEDNLDNLSNFITNNKTVIKNLFKVIDELTEKNKTNDYKYAFASLESIIKIFDIILGLDDKLTIKKIFKIQLKSKLISNIIEDFTKDLINTLIEIADIDKATNRIENIESIFEIIDDIYDTIPGVKRSIHNALKINYVKHNTDLISLLVANINDAPKFTRQQTLNETWPKLFTAIYTLLDGKELSKYKEINDSLIYINDTLLPNIFSIILSVNSMPKFTNQRAWKTTLKTILDEFDDTNDDSLANILAYKLSKGTLEDVEYLSNILIALSNVVTEINNIKKFDDDKIQGLLTVTKTIIEQFNEDNKESIASNFTNINDNDLEKIDTVIKLLEKLSKLNKIKIVLNISEGTIKAISLIGKPIKEFVETLGSISEDDLKKANESINSFIKIVGVSIIAALALVGIGLLMPLIKPDALFSFVAVLGAFLFGLAGITLLLSKALDDSMQCMKDATIFVSICAGILILGALINKYIDFGDILGFLIKLGTFIIGIATILAIITFLFKGKLMQDGLRGLYELSLIAALASFVMVLASLANDYIEFSSLFGFLIKFGLYIVSMGLLCVLLGTFKQYIGPGMLVLLGVIGLTLLAIGVMQLMYWQAKQENYYDTIIQGIKAMGWVFGSFIAVIAVIAAIFGFTGGVAVLAVAGALAAIAALIEIVKEASKAMQMIYVALSNFKNLNLEEEDFDRMADMIKGFAMLSVLLVDKIPLRKLAKLAVASKVIHKTAVAIGAIAKALKEFATLRIPTEIGSDGKPAKYVTVADGDFSTAQENIGKILTCVINGVLSVAKTHPELFEDHLLTDSPAMNAAKVAYKMGQALGSIAKGVSEFASQKIAIEFDDNGKPKKYVHMTDAMMREAAITIKRVLVCIGSALTETVKDNSELFEEGVIADSPAMNAAKTMKVMGDVIANAATAIGGLASGYVPTYDKDGKLNDKDKWLTFKLEDLKEDGPVYKAVNSILTCLGNSLKAVVDNEENKWMFDDGLFADSPAMNAAKAMKNTGDALNSTIDAITKISEIKTEDLASKIDTMQANIQSAINSVLKVFEIFTNTDNTGIKKEAVKSGLRGFTNDLYKFVGGDESIYETNGSIAQYINDNIGEIEEAGGAIKNITNVISSIISSLSKVGAANDNLKKYKDLFDESSDTKLSTVFAKIMTQLIGVHNSISYQFGNVDINSQIKKTEELNKLIDLYVYNLETVVKLSKFASETGEEGYNILRDGILSIYSATSQIGSELSFYFHVEQLKNYIKTINSIKLDNLNSLKGFIDSLNELSSRLGNLDKLTDAIGNKLSEVLYQLVLQLRKAEATITNAHELQEKRKKLMEESISKIETIMNQHMIVEISQAKDDNKQQSEGRINNTPVADNSSTGTDTTPPTETAKKDNPENTTAATGTGKDTVNNLPGWGSAPWQVNDVLTYKQFTAYMEKEFMDKFRNGG